MCVCVCVCVCESSGVSALTAVWAVWSVNSVWSTRDINMLLCSVSNSDTTFLYFRSN